MTNARREKLLQINSHDRVNKSSTQASFSVSLGKDEHINSVRGICVKDVQMINSFYNINKNNNTFYYDRGVEFPEQVIVLEPGQYNITSFIDAMVAAFLANGIPMLLVDNPLTHKLEFSSFPAISYYKTLADGSLNPMHKVLGIRVGKGRLNIQETYTAEGLHDLSGLKSIYILSDTLSGGYCNCSRDGGSRMSLLDVIPVKQPFGGIIHRNPGSFEVDTRSYDNILSNNLSSISIELRDSENNLLDTNGTDIVIVLKIFY